jgi:hypothetical protein
MKKVIDLLQKSLEDLKNAIHIKPNEGYINDAADRVKAALVELKAGVKWETPEQWEKRTGNKYPEDAAVRIFYSPEHGWDLMEYWRAKQLVQDLWRLDNDFDVDPGLIPMVCDCGVDGPPPDGWRPEEEKCR